MRYRVGVLQVYEEIYRVEADSEEDALLKVMDLLESGTEPEEVEYVESLDSTGWSVEEV